MEEIRIAAEQGDAEAQYQLGLTYLDGKSSRKEQKIGFAWIQKAADQGHAEAMKKLSWCYLYGKGVSQNFKLALEISQKAYGTDAKVDMTKFGLLINK